MKRPAHYIATILLAFISFSTANAAKMSMPETVVIEAGSFMYRASGEFLKERYPVDAPMQKIAFAVPFEFMKYQVLAKDYEQCVTERVCGEPLNQRRHSENLPITSVSYQDAINFAKWLSDKTDVNWRLPTDEEWAFAAGSRFVDDAINAKTNTNNPAERWLTKYKKYADLETGNDPVIKPSGSYGSNENGIYDLSGNVWEWTDSCYTRTRLDSDGKKLSQSDNCGVRIAAGQHRAYISYFIQDAKGGGCSVGAPPTYLGIRLIKMPRANLLERILNFVDLTGRR